MVLAHKVNMAPALGASAKAAPAQAQAQAQGEGGPWLEAGV